jgi:hypothetical protein
MQTAVGAAQHPAVSYAGRLLGAAQRPAQQPGQQGNDDEQDEQA